MSPSTLALIRALPKIELHLHLDCSLTYEVASRINPSLSFEDYRQQFIAPPKCLDLADYLTRARQGVDLMQTEEQLGLVVGDLFDQLARDNVLYAEIRFAPHLHTRRGLRAQDVVEIVDGAIDRERARTGVDARAILCALRHYDAAQSLDTARLVHRFRGRNIVALDLAGDEAGYPLQTHIPAFSYAAEHDIARTAHAGEARGPESVWETLREFRPTRLGHGVRSIEDPLLVSHLREQRIHLEICPTSNVQTNVVPAHAAHQIDRLYSAGVSLSVNTDARTISDVTLEREYLMLHENFLWGIEQFGRCNFFALQAAFIPEREKAGIADRLRAHYGNLCG